MDQQGTEHRADEQDTEKYWRRHEDLHNPPRGLTRRQFLSYTLAGTGAFMGMTVLTPLVAFTADPIRRVGASSSVSATTWRVSDFNEKLPTHVWFKQHIDDAWNSHDIPNDVYVIVYQNKLMVMSHVCTHLGCHVNGSYANSAHTVSAEPQYGGGKYWFHCPCHGSMYNIYGVNSPASPAPRPLDLFEYQIVNGYVHVGQTFRRYDSSWDVNPNPTIA